MHNYFPKISIITPNLNGGKFLENTILSIINQKYPNVELIVIDGGSTDNSIEIIKKYQEHIHYWVSEPDSGQTEAINKGLSRCTGQWVNWINSDDTLAPGALHFIAQISDTPNVHVISGSCAIIDTNQKILRYTYGLQKFSSLPKTIGCVAINQPEVFWKLQIVKTLSPLCNKLHYNMDKELYIKYLLKYGNKHIFHTKKQLAYFTCHPESKTCTKNKFFTHERDLIFLSLAKYSKSQRLYTQISKIIGNKPIEPDIIWTHTTNKSLIKKVFSYFYLLKADEYFVEKKWKQSEACLRLVPFYLCIKEPRLYFSLFFKHLSRKYFNLT